ALDAYDRGLRDAPVHPEPEVRATYSQTAGLERNPHALSVRVRHTWTCDAGTTGRVARDRLSWAKPRAGRAVCACHEDLRSHTCRPRAQLGDRRCIRADARAVGDPDS